MSAEGDEPERAGPATGTLPPGPGAEGESPGGQDPGEEPGPGAKQGEPAPEEPKKAPPRPEFDREDVSDYDETRNRILVGPDSVVYAYCDISAETFTGRDSQGAEAGELLVAKVRTDHLAKLDDVYEAPDCARDGTERLKRDRVLPLQGAGGSGRTTLAIQLLRERVDGEVWQIRPGTPLAELSQARLGRGRGYFWIADPDDVVTDFDVTRMRGLCEEHGTYLVLIVSGRQAPLSDVTALRVTSAWADLGDLLVRHAVRGLAADRHGRARALLERPELAGWCGGRHALAEIEAVAAIVGDVARDRIRIDALATHLDLLGGEKIRAWFDDPAHPRLRALKIALGFFGGLPLRTVLDIEDRLTVLLRAAADDKEPRDLFGVSARGRLESVSAVVEFADHADGFGGVHTEVVEFADAGWEASLTRLLRTEYPAVRPVLIAWLRDLAAHPDPQVQRRAALMLGTFAEDSLETLYHQVILPWARTSEDRLRMLVVMALTVPLADPRTAPRVLRIVRAWADSADPDLITVAALVYGLAIAPANTRAALNGLVRIARRRGDGWTRHAAAEAAAGGVFAMYLSDPVDDGEILAALLRWARSKRRSARDFATFAFLFIGDSVTEIAYRGRKRRPWPSLLRAFTQPATRQVVADLLREALANVEWSESALDVLRSWFTRANNRAYLVGPLAELVSALCATPAEAERLAFHLSAWARTNPGGAADQVRLTMLGRPQNGDGR